MTYVHHNNQYLYSLTPAKWETLLNNHIIHHLLVEGFKTITNVRNQIKDIATTKNKKFRNKKIDAFIMLCDSIKMCGVYEYLTEWIIAVSKELDKSDLNYDNVDLSRLPDETLIPVIRKYPEYDVSSAYQIGDSKHYTSCLRSGLQRYVANLKDNAIVPITWETKDTLKRTWYDKFNAYEGCNYHDYTRIAEVKAYKDGDIIYATIGQTVTEGGEGYLGRFRIYRCKIVGTDTIAWVLGEYYGQDKYIPLLLSKILRTLGPNVYTSCDSVMVTSHKPVTIERAFETAVYFDLGKDVFKLLSANPPKPRMSRRIGYGRKYFTVHIKGYSTRPEALVKVVSNCRTRNQVQSFIEYPLIDYSSSYKALDITSNHFVGYYIDLINKCIGTDFRCVKTGRYSSTVQVLYGSKCHGKLSVYYDTIKFDTELYSCVVGSGQLKVYKKDYTYHHDFELVNIKGNSAIRRIMTEGLIDKLLIKDKSNNNTDTL